VAVLVNDFGEINVDARLFVSIEGETVSLANGCVCCTIRDDLLTEVLRLLGSDPRPEHIVIETSGVSKPVSVAETFLSPSVRNLVDVHNMIMVVDADLVLDESAGYGDLAFDQIKIADTVVVNKTDLVPPRQLAGLKQRIEAIVPGARIWETTFGAVPLDLVFHDQISQAMDAVREGGAPRTGHEHPNDPHQSTFRSWTYRRDEAWSFGALERAVAGLHRGIYRAKGIVRLDLETGDYGVFQLTGRRATLRLQEPDGETTDGISTELLFIGSPETVTGEGIAAVFEQALRAARREAGKPYTVGDLRAFNVVFA
jgi:G3E family GTPase